MTHAVYTCAHLLLTYTQCLLILGFCNCLFYISCPLSGQLTEGGRLVNGVAQYYLKGEGEMQSYKCLYYLFPSCLKERFPVESTVCADFCVLSEAKGSNIDIVCTGQNFFKSKTVKMSPKYCKPRECFVG